MRIKMILALMILALGLPSPLLAEDVNNQFCPISGDKVGEMGEPTKVEYKGKTYNLCCKMCEKDFQKDPEAYIKKMEAKEAAGAEHSEHAH